MSLLCSECLMRYRIAAISETDAEPSFGTDALVMHTNPAETVIQGMALCIQHLVECVQLQRSSALVAPNGGQLVVPQLAVTR